VADFAYEAVTGTGQRSLGNLVAASEREVVAMLEI
jgi:hypothetical protein